jgi:hypothetical protein
VSERLEQLERWIAAEEDEHLEFKEANNRFDFELLVKYCCAFANEGGGRIVLGISDARPRRVVGSQRDTMSHCQAPANSWLIPGESNSPTSCNCLVFLPRRSAHPTQCRANPLAVVA